MKGSNSIKILSVLVMLCIALIHLSCSDKVKGCTDPEAETYNPDAESNEQSSCIYARDKFVGEYEGNLSCLGNLGLIIMGGETTFSIVESSTGSQYVDITIMSDPLLRLEATVSQSDLIIDTKIPNVVISGTPFDVSAVGTLTLSVNEEEISGVLSVTLAGETDSITDDCSVSGIKK
jgi:hypothetical protein